MQPSQARDQIAARILETLARHEGGGYERLQRVAAARAFLGVGGNARGGSLDLVLVGPDAEGKHRAIAEAVSFVATATGMLARIDPESGAGFGSNDLVVLTRDGAGAMAGGAAIPDVARAGCVILTVAGLAGDETLNDPRQAAAFDRLNYRPALPARAIVFGCADVSSPDMATVIGLNAACGGKACFFVMPETPGPLPCVRSAVAKGCRP